MRQVEGVPTDSEEVLRYFTRAPLKVKTVKVKFRGVEQWVKIYEFLDTEDHYSDSFGLQWGKYREIQIDRFNGTRGTYKHLVTVAQGDLSVFDGAVCLEIGSGAGRFTDYLVDMCKAVITVDPSAVLVNVALGAPNVVPCRADLFDIPIRRSEVDVVFCRGVIQHTVSPHRAIEKLFGYVKKGGVVLFDVYPLKWYTPFVTKYWLRPLTRRVDPGQFVMWAERWVPRALQLKRNVVNRVLPNNLLGINLSNQLIPIADFSRSDELSWEQQVQWSVLDTVDMYTPRFDRPMTFRSVLRVLEAVGAREIRADRSSFCFRGIAP